MKNRVNVLMMTIALSCLAAAPVAAQVSSGQKVETKGLILTRDGDTLSLESNNLGKVLVAVGENTKVHTPKGLFRHNDMEVTSLVPGLDVEVKGVGDDNGRIAADTIRFSKESLRIAQQVHAGMTATKAQVATNQQDIGENQRGISANAEKIGTNKADIAKHTEEIKAAEKRFNDLTEFDVKKDVTITFETGKSDVSDDAKKQLADLAKEANGMKTYLVEVQGFASTSGGSQLNQQLSEDRAENVTDFLHQQGIPMRRIVNPAAMGTTNPVADNETGEGRAQNQRVEVKILVNRGLAAK
jgi:OOP family OmpA-OmpF porin